MIEADFREVEDTLEDLARAETRSDHRQISLRGSAQWVCRSICCFDGSRMVIQSPTYKDTISSPAVHFNYNSLLLLWIDIINIITNSLLVALVLLHTFARGRNNSSRTIKNIDRNRKGLISGKSRFCMQSSQDVPLNAAALWL